MAFTLKPEALILGGLGWGLLTPNLEHLKSYFGCIIFDPINSSQGVIL